MKEKKQTELVIFKGKKGVVKLRGDLDRETLWATQADMAKVFGVTSQNITLHLKNIYKDTELVEGTTCKESLQVQKEGSREVTRRVKLYNLDVMIAVGYRVGSVTGTRFRQWATTVLRKHITDGYTINQNRIGQNYADFMKAVETVRALAPAHGPVDTESVLELVRLFADTWFSLDAYDKGELRPGKVTKKKVKLTSEDLLANVSILKGELMKKSEATEHFATERTKGSVEGIVGNVMQSLGGASVYPTVEAKAAHLLYFIIKNHPFVDGNKRTGAYAFVWFLRKAQALDTTRLTPAALTALTLLIAESNPHDKEKMVELVIMLLAGPNRKSLRR